MASQDTPKAYLNPYAKYVSATVASAPPVKFTEEQAKAQQQKKAPASLFHNPHNIKRPQAKKPGPTVKKPLMPAISASATSSAPTTTGTQQHGIDYYRSTVDDDAAILEERRQRQYDERQRKKDLKKFHKQYGYWNPTAPHKPERFSNLRAYRASGGYTRKKDDFKTFLRQAAEKARSREETGNNSSPPRPTSSLGSQPPAATIAKPSFAPPTSYDPPTADMSERVGQSSLVQQQDAPPPPPPPPPPPFAGSVVPPPPPPTASVVPMAQVVYHNPTISAPPVRYANATISAPPIRFERPDVKMGDSDEEPYEEEVRPTKRTKVGNSKAEAMMLKMGYVKGQGLGKNNDGVLTHLEVKRRKVPQGAKILNDDNTKVSSQQVWDVHGGLRNHKDEPSQFGEESSIVVAWGCVDGIDWHENAQRDDGGIRQEMGEAFGAKFGPVQQIQLNEASNEGAVYIKFESVMSALNAVNRFREGFQFRDQTIRARFYDEKKFHSSIWDH
ncbi:hypothetical protein GQ44DRAFT_701030 [Phaeosphaeriaceae sp. PMI808]|nr:hypothetical protein GQ44DRAFT_701030 [Phaeosphaeriaceae sp. PMI808]